MVSTVFGGPEPLFLLLLALVTDLLAGDRVARLLPDPARASMRFCEALDRRLNRPQRSPRDRLLRGLLVVLAVVAAAVAAGMLIERTAGALDAGLALNLAVLVATLRGRAAWVRVRETRRALDAGGLIAGQDSVTGITRRHAYTLDEHGVARAAIEHAARAFDRKFIAPVFWYVLLGLPGLLAWAAVDGAEAALGQPGVRHAQFGLTAARLDDALNALPARLAAILLGVAALFLGVASLPGAFATIMSDARRGASFNMGWPLAAMAGALGLALGGPYRDGGVVVDSPWVGAGRARATPADIDRALALTGIAALLTVLLTGLLVTGVAGV